MDSEEQEQRKYSPEVMDISDEEIDYDTYLDQLDDDEVPISATITSSLVLSSLLQDTLPKLGGEEIDPFSEDFPVINRASAPEISIGGGSLMALVGVEVVKDQGPVIRRVCSIHNACIYFYIHGMMHVIIVSTYTYTYMARMYECALNLTLVHGLL